MTECKPQTWEDEGGVAVEIFLMLYICYGFYVITDFYLVPAISKVCSQLRIPDDVAGATILGAALNAPELFSSIISIFILKNPVGVGLIMGSFNFNLLCITGFTSLFSRQNLRARQLKLEWRYLQRDVFFYALAVVLLIVTTWDEHLGWQDCVSLLGLYVAYVGVCAMTGVLARLFCNESRKPRRERPLEAVITEALGEDFEIDEAFEGALQVILKDHFSQMQPDKALDPFATTQPSLQAPLMPFIMTPVSPSTQFTSPVPAPAPTPVQSMDRRSSPSVESWHASNMERGELTEDALLEAMKYLMKRGYNIMHEHAEQNWERKHMHLRQSPHKTLTRQRSLTLPGNTSSPKSTLATMPLHPPLPYSPPPSVIPSAGSMHPTPSHILVTPTTPRGSTEVSAHAIMARSTRAASDGHTTPSLLSTSVPADSPANDILSLDETIAAGSDNPREDQEPVEKPTRATAGPPSAQSSELPVSCPYQAPTPSLNGDPTMTTSGARPRSNTLQIPNLIARAQQMRLSSPGQKWDWSSARAGAASSEFRRPRAGSLLKVDARLITVATDRKARMPFAPDVMDLAAAEEVTMEHDEAGEILHWPADAPPTAKAVFVITLPLRIMAWCTMPRTPREQKTVAICGALIWLPVLAYALELSASRAACVVGIPDELVGKTLVAIGTSLPNVLAAVAAGRRGQVETAVSQAFGSNIFDILIAFALPYTIQCGVRGWEPVKLEAKSVASEGTADIVILGCFVLALFYTRMRLTKGLGMILVGGYAVYLVYTCLNFYNIHTSFRITI
ncbi:hypothetical protein CYMTET_32371 [Cymbomonas tetramitiformis]|uniref:Sodium/calcium exchanger membrane region domain-containing protein n=1 Tax=Cymbomonas tetramitiformis TaxID=36881 RepID=A0AAE0KS96_9CHLO|nr:hypothetical protein CYMTET_32371 [Cymbomonas tetramitiformis]